MVESAVLTQLCPVGQSAEVWTTVLTFQSSNSVFVFARNGRHEAITTGR
jgi:hypothetical protein